MAQMHTGYADFLSRCNLEDAARVVTYTNSTGRAFTSTVQEILTHVALHAQYHRGKVNLLLRQAGIEPAPADYIAWVRGVPAATERDAGGGETR